MSVNTSETQPTLERHGMVKEESFSRPPFQEAHGTEISPKEPHRCEYVSSLCCYIRAAGAGGMTGERDVLRVKSFNN